jgi:hypothetical protein
VGTICDTCLTNSRSFRPPRRSPLRRVPADVPEHADPRPPELRVVPESAPAPAEDEVVLVPASEVKKAG